MLKAPNLLLNPLKRLQPFINKNTKASSFSWCFFHSLNLKFTQKLSKGGKMKKNITLFILLLLVLSFSLNISAESYSWYIIRNNENKQPQTDSRYSFIEKYNAFYLNKNYTNESRDKVIYLTFDAGYSNENLKSILDTLKEENVTAAFFILSNLVLKSPDIVKQMANDGHFVCNHTSKHLDISKASNKDEIKTEIKKLEDVYRDLTGEEMKKYFRPPEGRFNEESISYINELGYKTVFWSFAYEDWDNEKQPSLAYAKQKIFANLHNGEIMLLHPTSKTNAAILKDVISELKSRGYRFGTLDEL